MKKRLMVCYLFCNLIVVLLLPGCGGENLTPALTAESKAESTVKLTEESKAEAVLESADSSDPAPSSEVEGVAAI